MEKKEIATRNSYGQALVELGKEKEDLYVVDADLSSATKTIMFKDAFPNRFVNCGIAEANMMCVAAGLSLTKKVVYASSFAMFATGRAFEQIRNSIGYPNLNVKICATHASISVGEDGATHQCNEDVALMRTIPTMKVIVPCDHYEAMAATKAAYNIEGPVYIRLSRAASPIINDENYKFEFSKGITLVNGNDATIIAMGFMVEKALNASDILKKEGINVRVINMHTVKPIDEDIIKKACIETKVIVTTEEHSIIGGLGDAVLSIASQFKTPVVKHGIDDEYGISGNFKELFEHFKLTEKEIVKKVKYAMSLI